MLFSKPSPALPAIGRAELLGDNAFTVEPTSLAEYSRAVLLVMLVEYDAQI